MNEGGCSNERKDAHFALDYLSGKPSASNFLPLQNSEEYTRKKSQFSHILIAFPSLAFPFPQSSRPTYTSFKPYNNILHICTLEVQYYTETALLQIFYFKLKIKIHAYACGCVMKKIIKLVKYLEIQCLGNTLCLHICHLILLI